jgi:hypothetical protein
MKCGATLERVMNSSHVCVFVLGVLSGILFGVLIAILAT